MAFVAVELRRATIVVTSAKLIMVDDDNNNFVCCSLLGAAWADALKATMALVVQPLGRLYPSSRRRSGDVRCCRVSRVD